MDTIFSDWKTALDDLKASVSEDLAEILKQKAEIQKLKADIFKGLSQGKYIHDDQRIVLSAPEIVIGNVDMNGMLYADTGAVVIRGGSVSLEGSGEGGTVQTRAASISQLAVDPGADGVQEAVLNNSTIISQAKNIIIQSNESEGYFSRAPQPVGGTGVRIHADANIEIEAAQSSELRSDDISNKLTDLNAMKSTLTSEANSKISSVKSLMSDIEDLLEDHESMDDSVMAARTNVLDLDESQENFEQLTAALQNAIESSIRTLSSLAETNRRITALKNEQKKVDSASSTFKDATTYSQLLLHGEIIGMGSFDADGNVRTNPEAMIEIQTGKLDITTLKEDGSLIDDSHVTIHTKDIDINTSNPALTDGDIDNGEFPADGSVHVLSKNISFEAVDYSRKDGLDEEKQQTAEGSFSVRAESIGFRSMDTEGNTTGSLSLMAENTNMSAFDKDGNATGSMELLANDMILKAIDKDGTGTGSITVKAEDITVSSADKEGKALGQVSVNGKNVFIKSMDTDDKGADKNLATGGNMVLVAENMFVGRTDKDNTSKTLQISSDKTGIYGTTTAEMQQGEAKAVVQLDGGSIAISGSKAEFYGDNTVNGKTDFKADATMTKLTADNVEAKSSFKSTNISDGVAVPGAPSSAKLSAKLKEEDAPKPKVVEADAEGGGQG